MTDGQTGSEERADSEYEDNGEKIKRNDITTAIYKINLFKIFVLDIRLDIINKKKLQYI